MDKSPSQIRPIQLISFDSNKNLVLSQKAANVFNEMDTSQLYVVIVAGKYRTGKSYILNRVLLNRNSGFQVGPTINACTKGLWMWPQLVKITDDKGVIKNCIIIDTQGLGSLQQGENSDIKIFLMATLLSSYLIYNSVGNIDEKAIENLSLVINMAQMLHKQNNQYDAQQLINAFPSFMWLVRDFSLRLQNQNGQPITSKQYLQTALKYQNQTSEVAKRKNLIRKKLKSFFQDRNCFTLIRPTENQKDLQNLSKLSERKLRPQFVGLIQEFKNTIYSELKPKKIKGKSVSPQGFIELCKYFIEMINSGKLPSINSHWDNICVKQSSRIIDKYAQSHHNNLFSSISSSQFEQLDIDLKIKRVSQAHEQIFRQACFSIDKSFLGKLEKQLSKERLYKFLTKIYDQVIQKISEQKYMKAKQIVSQIFTQIVIEFSANKLESFQQIFSRFEEIKQKYKHDSRIYQSFYENSKDVFQQFLRNLKNQWQRDNQVLFQRNGYLQNQIQLKTSEMKRKIQQYYQQNRIYEQKNYKNLLEITQKNNEITYLKNSLQKITHQKQFLQQNIEQLELFKKQKERQQSYENKKQNDVKIKHLQEYKIKLEIQLAKLEQSLKATQIKQRKIQRQMQIFKNKCSEYLKQNINLSEQIEKVKKKLLECDKQSRKSAAFLKNTQGSSDGVQLASFINSLNNKIDELEVKINSKQQQNRNLNKLLSNQTLGYETLLKTPQNINYQLLKKNYDIQCENNIKANSRLKQIQSILMLCSYKCLLCKNQNQFNDLGIISRHIKGCIKNRQIDFDVSYEYNGNGELQFVIDVIVDNYQHEWTVRKTLKNLYIFFKKFYGTFNKFQPSKLFLNNSSAEIYTFNQEQIQQRRAYLSQIFNQFRSEVWQNTFILQFFAFDIHFLSEKKVNTVSKQHSKSKSVKSSKISKASSELQISLSGLVDQNYDSSSNLANSGSNLLMKTCKFSKKTFNFGSFL